MSLEFNDAKESMPLETYGLFEHLATHKDLSRWTLVGGTALSLYLKHRTSEDLDFFVEDSEFTKGSLKEIDALVKYFEDIGLSIVLTDKTDRLYDYMVGNVKVTFFASGLKGLKNNAQRLGSIDIASVEQIAAMKLESIIKYRTVTRDFFDVYTLWQQSGMDLHMLIENYRDKYSSKVSIDLFEQRFFDRRMDSNDPGFGTLKFKEKITPDDIRHKYLEWIVEKTEEENQIIQRADEVDESICNTYFGNNRQSLLQKLCSVGRDDLVIKYLEAAVFDLDYEDFSGKNLIDYYKSNRKMQKTVAGYLRSVPPSWIGSGRYMFDEETLDLLRYENAVIIQAKGGASPEKLERVATKKVYDIEQFNEDVTKKAALLNQAAFINGGTPQKRETFFPAKDTGSGNDTGQIKVSSRKR